MRALLVAAAPVAGSVALVARLAHQCDLVIAVDGGGSVCLDAGVKPHMVLGDFDSLHPETLEELTAQGTRVVRFPSHKDRTDLELAFEEARRAGADEVVVTCAVSGRLDHTLAALGALIAAADLRPELAEPDLSGWVLSLQGRGELMLEGVGATVSLMAMCSGTVVSAQGVKWPLEAHKLPEGSGLGVSNVITSESGATLNVVTGAVLVLAPMLPLSPQACAR
jgi:thiamine pyrophosphokinase